MVRDTDINERLRNRPFEAFRVHTTDGAHYDIWHPELVWVLRHRIEIAIRRGMPSLIDRIDSVALLHIVRIEPLAEAG